PGTAGNPTRGSHKGRKVLQRTQRFWVLCETLRPLRETSTTFIDLSRGQRDHTRRDFASFYADSPLVLRGLCFALWCKFAGFAFAKLERQYHGHTLLVAPVRLPMEIGQVLLFKLYRHEDVRGRCYRKHKVWRSHDRSRPEGKQPTQVKRMSHVLVQNRRSEYQGRTLLADQKKINLSQPKKIKVVQ